MAVLESSSKRISENRPRILPAVIRYKYPQKEVWGDSGL